MLDFGTIADNINYHMSVLEPMLEQEGDRIIHSGDEDDKGEAHEVLDYLENCLLGSLCSIRKIRARLVGYDEPVPTYDPTIDLEESVLYTIAKINERRPSHVTKNWR